VTPWSEAIVVALLAREHQLAVLTDDLDLSLALSQEEVPVLNFTHMRAQAWGFSSLQAGGNPVKPPIATKSPFRASW
jgi:hypothetical protein